MQDLIGYIIALPLAAFMILSILGSRLGKKSIAFLGVMPLGLSAIIAIVLAGVMVNNPSIVLSLNLGEWFHVNDLQVNFGLYLDSLSFTFIFVITFVGFLIHLYSLEFMYQELGYARFFAYMNLFVACMLILVVADNLLLLYLGWEGVGLCSFLLIGFWYKNPKNARAARKAFIVTRIGDTLMAIGLFFVFYHFNTLDIRILNELIPQQWPVASKMATIGSLLFIGGAVGKSAQLPLHTWLPDAMAGPSPVSALIHAATMVTAGVYLIARMHALFIQSPFSMMLVAGIGSITLLIAGLSALAQRDIKKVLAYSTISQVGYMFLALGLGAWSAAIFHFMIHAFFKALLFLGAGVIIMAMQDEHDMFKMGGLRKKLPLTFVTFLIGAASLASLPIITAGYYSKDLILWYAWSGVNGNVLFWLAGFFGAFITAVYSFRMIFVTFYGEQKISVHRKPGIFIKIPLLLLALFSLIGGLINLSDSSNNLNFFSRFINHSLPQIEININMESLELIFQVFTSLLTLLGIYVAYLFFRKRSKTLWSVTGKYLAINNLLLSGWHFDKLYDYVFVKPIINAARVNKSDFVNVIYTLIAKTTIKINSILVKTQTGKVRLYLLSLAFGAIVLLAILTIL